MVKAVVILEDKSGKTIGVRLQDEITGEIRNYSTGTLQQEKFRLKLSNAIIDSNGFVRAKHGYAKLSRTVFEVAGTKPQVFATGREVEEDTRPMVDAQMDRARADKLLKDAVLTLYHGNKDKDMIPKFGYGEKKNDYGQGFYTTTVLELAKEWAWSGYTQGDKAYVHTYSFDTTGLNILNLTRYDSIYWVAELVANRTINLSDDEMLDIAQENQDILIQKYKIDTSPYDIIIGYRADDSYFQYAEAFVAGALSKDALDKALRYGELGLQVFIKSERAFDLLNKEGIQEVPLIYKKKYRDRDDNARRKYSVLSKQEREKRIKGTAAKRLTIRDYL